MVITTSMDGENTFRQSRERKFPLCARALKAAEAGHLWSWHIIGDIYWNGRAVECNLPYALECYKKTASYGNDNYACRQLGRLYFNGWGTAVDYAQAVQWLERDKEPEGFKYDLLGICYLLGRGCQQNPARGKAFLEKSQDSPYKSYGLGMMYAGASVCGRTLKRAWSI